MWIIAAARDWAAHYPYMGMMRFASRTWKLALDLVFPRWCAGCGQWDEDLCESCRTEFVQWQQIQQRLPYLSHVSFDGNADYSPFPCYALSDYAGNPARAIVRWKNVSDAGLDGAFSRLVCARGPVVLPAQRNSVLVVPAPSQQRRRKDGRFVAGVLAQAIATVQDGVVCDVLRKSTPKGGGLIERGAKARTIGIAKNTSLNGFDVVLVDDVATTGATLAGASRTVKSAGGRVIGAFVLAAAKDPRNFQWVSSQSE